MGTSKVIGLVRDREIGSSNPVKQDKKTHPLSPPTLEGAKKSEGVLMKDVKRVLPGNAKPFERFWRVVDAADSESGESELWFYGFISEYSWDQDDITPGLMREDLERFGGKPITLRIHSAGGEVFAASAIRSMLMAYPGYVTARIEGLCASAATYVAMAADKVLMQDSAFFMVHDPWTIALGGIKELSQVVKMLKALKKGIVETYQNKTDLGADVLAKMMEDETWMSAQKALELGFVDEVITERSASVQFEELARAANLAVVNALPDFAKVPEVIRDAYSGISKGLKDPHPSPSPTAPLERAKDAHSEDDGHPEALRVRDSGTCTIDSVHGEDAMNEQVETHGESAHGEDAMRQVVISDERVERLREKIKDIKNQFRPYGSLETCGSEVIRDAIWEQKTMKAKTIKSNKKDSDKE